MERNMRMGLGHVISSNYDPSLERETGFRLSFIGMYLFSRHTPTRVAGVYTHRIERSQMPQMKTTFCHGHRKAVPSKLLPADDKSSSSRISMDG